jgi:flagellar basal body-associated protein FliL
MFSICHTRTFATAFGLLAMVVPCAGQDISNEELQDLVSDLKAQNQTLRLALVESNKAEKKSTDQLNQVRERLEALGKNLLDGGDDRLIQAAADLELANERNAELESAAMRLSSAVQDYLRQAVVSDPDARLRVETAMRELDSASGLRQKPLPDVRTGDLRQAQIVSLDQQSGMLVLNLGETQGARIGMTFRLMRGQQQYGKAILADVRKAVSGAFVEQIDSKDQTPRLGDTAVLLTQQKQN